MPKDYQNKRNFKITPEPAMEKKNVNRGPLVFVVQKHSARQLHYDFRLEVDGVLKSWAVSKGPSDDPTVKRLAVMVEDHPRDYANFEGTIPAGQYGAGQVILWDRGTYSPDENGELHFDDRKQAEELMRKGLDSGKISITLRGEKLKGSWTLVKMKQSDNNWLLIKHRDEYTDSGQDILEKDKSVLSGLTIDDLKSGSKPELKHTASVSLPKVEGTRKAAFPSKISPKLASLARAPFSDEKWLFEPKLDGFRTMAFINNGRIWLQSRNEIDVTGHYKTLIDSLKQQAAAQLVLDGEIVALDAKGKLCFQCLQGYLKSMNHVSGKFEMPTAIIYYVFDILYLDGYDLKGVLLTLRKELLKKVLKPTKELRLVEDFDTNGEKVYHAAVENGLEGVVAKQKDSIYEPGKRSKNWLKIKAVKSDEFIIGGFTEGTGNRSKTFGALVLGYYDKENNLQPAGNVGTGFDDAMLASLRKQLDSIVVKRSPFKTQPDGINGVTWVKPEMVVEVKFAEWTQDNRLRAPVFLRVRDDKAASAVHPTKVVEKPQAESFMTAAEKDGSKDVLAQMENKDGDFILEIEGQKVSLANLDKAIWPATKLMRGLTKRDLITYLIKVAPYLLPHLKDRPLSLSRFPNGIFGQHFFQKHYKPLPDYVETVVLSAHELQDQEYLLCNNLATLLWLGQIADIELHSWFSRVVSGEDFKVKTKGKKDPDYYVNFPDFLIFDIDPYIYSGKEAAGDEPELNRTAFSKTCQVALKLRETLDTLKCPAFVKTSGKTGLHVFIPILRQLDFHGVHTTAETLCKYLQQKYPDEITIDWAVEKRAGKIFLDYNQNVRGKTLASIYSPRPSPQASVSVPLKWEELGKVYPTDFTILNVPDRLAKEGDIWANIMKFKIDIVKQFSGMAKES